MATFGITGILVLGISGGYIYKRHRAQANVTNALTSPSGPLVSERAKQVEAKILRGEALNDNDTAGMSAYELRVLRNVHFARYGRKYDQGGELGGYFYTRAWYKPSDTYNDNLINATDKANVALILTAEKSQNNQSTSSPPISATTPSSETDNASSLSSTNDLNRQTVLSLVRGRLDRVIEARMPDSSFYMYNRTSIYSQMVQEKILSCEWARDRWNNCLSGSKGGFKVVNHGNSWGGTLILIIGKMTPTEVTGISRVDQFTATADVLLTLQGNNNFGVYSRYSGAFDSAQVAERQTQRVLLRLYDDGWRFERSLGL